MGEANHTLIESSEGELEQRKWGSRMPTYFKDLDLLHCCNVGRKSMNDLLTISHFFTLQLWFRAYLAVPNIGMNILGAEFRWRQASRVQCRNTVASEATMASNYLC